jgi:hypothetical protein
MNWRHFAQSGQRGLLIGISHLLYVHEESGFSSDLVFTASGLASFFQTEMPAFLTRRTLRKLFSSPESPFLPVGETPRPRMPGFHWNCEFIFSQLLSSAVHTHVVCDQFTSGESACFFTATTTDPKLLHRDFREDVLAHVCRIWKG